jgi:hypothetical protein
MRPLALVGLVIETARSIDILLGGAGQSWPRGRPRAPGHAPMRMIAATYAV